MKYASDCAWALINCAAAIGKTGYDVALGAGEGVIQGAGNIGHMLANPVQTAQQLEKAIGTVCYQLAKSFYYASIVTDENIKNSPALAHYYNEIYQKTVAREEHMEKCTSAFVAALKTTLQEASARDISREFFAFVTEGYFTGKVIEVPGKILKLADSSFEVLDKIAKIADKASEAIAVTPEGIAVKPNHLENVSHFFKNWMEKAGETAREIAGFTRDISRTGNPKNIIKSVIIDSSHKGIIKKFDVLEKAGRHAFSDEHIRKGIYKLGKSEMDIINKITDIILKCDEQLLLKEGSNAIETLVNGFQTTIKVEIRTAEVLSINIFKGTSNYHAFPNIIRI